MTRARHRRPAPSPPRRDPRRLGALVVLAGVSALGAVAGPVAGAETELPSQDLVATLGGQAAFSSSFSTRQQQLRDAAAGQVSRSRGARDAVSAAPDGTTPDVAGPLDVPESSTAFAQDDTQVRAEPRAGSDVLREVERGDEVQVTGATQDGYVEVVLDGALAWVDADDVDDEEPPAEIVTAAGPVPADVSGSPCPSGSSVEQGLTSNAIAVHRAVCAAFPGLTYGGLRPGDSGEHGTGRALDIMVSGSRGDAVAAYLQQHASELGIDNLIWEQRIWMAGDPHSAWKTMADRGSATANHYDHVHAGTR